MRAIRGDLLEKERQHGKLTYLFFDSHEDMTEKLWMESRNSKNGTTITGASNSAGFSNDDNNNGVPSVRSRNQPKQKNAKLRLVATTAC